MFSFSVVEHVRLSFSLAVQNYSLHARAAERLAGLTLRIRLAILSTFALATGTIVASLFRPERGYQIAAAVFAGIALIGQTIFLAWGPETRVYTHRSLAHRLWLICERYRSLLAEIRDGLVDEAAIVRRGETLGEQVHAVYEQGFPVDQPGFENARQTTSLGLDDVGPAEQVALPN
jgi:hypothetical protein